MEAGRVKDDFLLQVCNGHMVNSKTERELFKKVVWFSNEWSTLTKKQLLPYNQIISFDSSSDPVEITPYWSTMQPQ